MCVCVKDRQSSPGTACTAYLFVGYEEFSQVCMRHALLSFTTPTLSLAGYVKTTYSQRWPTHGRNCFCLGVAGFRQTHRTKLLASRQRKSPEKKTTHGGFPSLGVSGWMNDQRMTQVEKQP